jgi:hypothetical protein
VQIDDLDGLMPLPEPTDTADPLFDPHRVPRHVVVDDRAADLEVQTLRRGIGAKQALGLAVAEAALDHLARHCSPVVVGPKISQLRPEQELEPRSSHRSGISGYVVRPPEAREKAKVSAFTRRRSTRFST